jgi:L-lactate utilization protein LutB
MVRPREFSAENLEFEAHVDPVQWNRLPSEEIIRTTAGALEQQGMRVVLVEGADDALSTIRQLIPAGAEVMQGSSTTLIEIGFTDLLASRDHPWVSLHDRVNAENDAIKRAEIRRLSITAEYFLSSANAISVSGELVACDMSGSRTGAWPYGAKHLVIVAGVNKIVPTLDDALRRVREYAYPLESARAMRAYGIPSRIGKCVILAFEGIEGRVTIILVRDRLGY